MDISIIDSLNDLQKTIEGSYAHNSYLYRYMERKATLEEIVQFLHWDSQQTAFKTYLTRWLDKSPHDVLPIIQQHIQEEDDHSELLSEMMTYLYGLTRDDYELNSDVIGIFDYTFSEQAFIDNNFEFFAGGLFATELMSHVRYGQILKGLLRVGIDKKHLHFITLHYECDEAHSMSALQDLIMPLLYAGGSYSSIFQGVTDRLSRSMWFLTFYEKAYLHV